MSTEFAEVPRSRNVLRLWPGVAAVSLQWLLWYGLGAAAPDVALYGVAGGALCAVVIALWWLGFSRAAWVERLGGIAVVAAGLYATKSFVDVSIATGAQGFLLYILALPGVCFAFVAWAVATRNLSDALRRVTMLAAILAACGFWTLIRTGGFSAGNFRHDLHWRWSETPEQRLAALPPSPPPPAPAPLPAPVSAPTAPKPVKHSLPTTVPAIVRPAQPTAVWPAFRGPHRNGSVDGVRIRTDWSASAPALLWRRPVGPGWSSFAVQGNLIYTQEQRGAEEVVACYQLDSGEPVWAHRDSARFWESNGGPGPRGTPTLSNGRVYAFGATGILNVLDARSGAVIWSRNAAADAAMPTPTWGFASSPVVTGDLVLVGAAGRLAAFDIATGEPRWMGPSHGVSYSSPLLLNNDGVDQVVLLSQAGATAVALADGAPLWEHAWKGYPIVQPGLTPDGDLLVSMSESSGLRRLAIRHDASAATAWTLVERWTSMGLKPYFNDFVVHQGHAYGFDGSILSCIDLSDGKRKWKGGRYGNGQMILLASQDVLLILSEQGELALVRATPDQYTELARLPAIEGKTWNHPVLAGNVLLVRNGEEMAAFRLSAAD